MKAGRTRRHLQQAGVDVRLRTAIAEVQPDRVRLQDGSTVRTDLVIWAAGVTGHPGPAAWGLPTGKGGRIEVRAAVDGDRVVLTVADDGGGIDPANRARLFRPYFTTKKHGTGLGLFVIRRIVEAHGGTVAVESEPGQGATFRVTLPAVRQPMTSRRPEGLKT